MDCDVDFLNIGYPEKKQLCFCHGLSSIIIVFHGLSSIYPCPIFIPLKNMAGFWYHHFQTVAGCHSFRVLSWRLSAECRQVIILHKTSVISNNNYKQYKQNSITINMNSNTHYIMNSNNSNNYIMNNNNLS